MNMIKTLMFVWMVAFSGMVNADDSLYLVCCTYHFEDTYRDWDDGEKKRLNNFNPGLIYTHDLDTYYSVMVGGYRNSERGTSYMVGAVHEWQLPPEWLSFKLSGGLVFGYERGTVPFVVPSFQLWDRVDVMFLPVSNGGVSVSGKILEW